jgi:Cdc6-like AAA superfamily ATPase
MGQEIFKERQGMSESIRRDPMWGAIWLYGTQGYGKSHILAFMVCYLVSSSERVVYIPDCEECRKPDTVYCNGLDTLYYPEI